MRDLSRVLTTGTAYIRVPHSVLHLQVFGVVHRLFIQSLPVGSTVDNTWWHSTQRSAITVRVLPSGAGNSKASSKHAVVARNHSPDDGPSAASGIAPRGGRDGALVTLLRRRT
jgi:hypothetical protein